MSIVISSVQDCHCFEDAKFAFLKNYQIHFLDKITLTLPSVFKCGSLSSVDFELKNYSADFRQFFCAIS